jgi:hypothetical protein
VSKKLFNFLFGGEIFNIDRSLIIDKPHDVVVAVGDHSKVYMEDKSMSENTGGRNIQIGNIGRDLIADGQAFNPGDISGQVINTTNQVPEETASSKDIGITELLTQLRKAVEDSQELSEGKKLVLLEQIQDLSKVDQVSEPEKKSILQEAQGMFDAVLKSLPDTAKIVESVGKLLPTILKLLGVA